MSASEITVGALVISEKVDQIIVGFEVEDLVNASFAGIKDELVKTAATGQLVRAIATRKNIVAIAAEELVVVEAAEQRVRARS